MNTLILFHGLGADGNDLKPIAEFLDLNATVIAPDAPALPISAYQKQYMPAWFDIFGFDRDTQVDQKGIKKSVALAHQFFDDAFAKSDKVYCLGFSQGGVVALYAALTYPKNITVASCSSYSPAFDDFAPQFKTQKVFLSHGKQDEVLDYSYGVLTKKRLENLGLEVEFFSDDSPHTISLACLERIKKYFHEN